MRPPVGSDDQKLALTPDGLPPTLIGFVTAHATSIRKLIDVGLKLGNIPHYVTNEPSAENQLRRSVSARQMVHDKMHKRFSLCCVGQTGSGGPWFLP